MPQNADVVEVVWKPVKDFEEFYEVSNLGQVRNRKGAVLKQRVKRTNCTCYKVVSLRKEGKYYTKYVHRLIAEAFIPNPDSLPIINHKDEDGTNNAIENLEWCTHKYNANYGTAIARMTEKIRGVKHKAEHNRKISESMKAYYAVNESKAKGRRSENGKMVVRIDPCGNMWIYETITDAAKHVGGAYQNIASCCNGKRKTAYGFEWKWYNNCGAKMDKEE